MCGKFDENFKASVTHFLLVRLLLDFSLTGVQDPFELQILMRQECVIDEWGVQDPSVKGGFRTS